MGWTAGGTMMTMRSHEDVNQTPEPDFKSQLQPQLSVPTQPRPAISSQIPSTFRVLDHVKQLEKSAPRVKNNKNLGIQTLSPTAVKLWSNCGRVEV
jgi:hypothetical protein